MEALYLATLFYLKHRRESLELKNCFNFRQQLESLYNKKKAYGAYTDKKKADIAAMVRDEVQKDIEKIVDTDYRLQMLYLTKKPRRLEVFDEDTLKELAALHDSTTGGSSRIGGTSGTAISSRSKSMLRY